MDKLNLKTVFFIVTALLFFSFVIVKIFEPKNEEFKNSEYQGATPVLILEFAKDPQIVKEVFYFQDETKRQVFAHEMRFFNILDYKFMFFYTLYMGLFAYMLYKRTGDRKYKGFLYFAAVIFLLDFFENVYIFKIIANIDGDFTPYFRIMQNFTFFKWLSIIGYYYVLYHFVARYSKIALARYFLIYTVIVGLYFFIVFEDVNLFKFNLNRGMQINICVLLIVSLFFLQLAAYLIFDKKLQENNAS